MALGQQAQQTSLPELNLTEPLRLRTKGSTPVSSMVMIDDL